MFSDFAEVPKTIVFLEIHRADLLGDIAESGALAQARCSFDSQHSTTAFGRGAV